MTFNDALNALNDGCCVTRTSKYKDMIVTKQVASKISLDIVPKMTSLNDMTKKILLNKAPHIYYKNQLILINLNTGDATNYIPSTDDYFANDWELVVS